MPHAKSKYILDIIKKKLSFSPVVTIQGARQTGKSCFVKNILKAIATLEHPDQASITKYCKRDARIVKKHIEALLILFVINQLQPYPGGTGKPI